jgi:hypothetical protein
MRDCRGGFSDVHSLGSGLFGFRPGIGSRIARLGFEFAVAVVLLLGIEDERADSLGSGFSCSLLVTASGFSDVFSLGGPSGFVCVTDFPSRA